MWGNAGTGFIWDVDCCKHLDQRQKEITGVDISLRTEEGLCICIGQGDELS